MSLPARYGLRACALIGVQIPYTTFKVVYSPHRQVAVVYVATNNEASVCTIMPVAALSRTIGIDPFPSLGPDLEVVLVTSLFDPLTTADGAGAPQLPPCAPAAGP